MLYFTRADWNSLLTYLSSHVPKGCTSTAANYTRKERKCTKHGTERKCWCTNKNSASLSIVRIESENPADHDSPRVLEGSTAPSRIRQLLCYGATEKSHSCQCSKNSVNKNGSKLRLSAACSYHWFVVAYHWITSFLPFIAKMHFISWVEKKARHFLLNRIWAIFDQKLIKVVGDKEEI